MRIYQISTDTSAKELLRHLGVDKAGIAIMAAKMELCLFYIEGISCGAANILKQDALSIGADLAVPVGVVTCEKSHVDAILMGTKKHIQILSKKELAQPCGLKGLALKLAQFLNPSSSSPKIMGIINANDDSFYPLSRFQGAKAIEAIIAMKEEGADIIDIGAVSSRPGSKMVGAQEELKRLRPIIDAIYQERIYEKITFSLDSYNPEAIDYALGRGFKIVNDITGLDNDEVARLAARYGAAVVIMHMQGSPEQMQHNPRYDNVVLEIDSFFASRIEKARRFGIEKIILDVGIGFGKTLEHNLLLIKHLAHFSHFGYELLVGASRKSMIDKISSASVELRLPGTLALHLKALDNGASIIRCHDVKEHVQALKVWQALKGTGAC